MPKQKMILKEELVVNIKMFSAPKLANYIMKTDLIKELVDCALSKDELLSSRAMWVLGHYSDLDYEKTIPFHDALIKNLTNSNLHNGVIRNTLRFFQTHAVPNKHQSFLLDKCFDYIKNPSQAIAVRAFAITVVFNIAKPYPELLNELLIVLKHLSVNDEPPAIRARVKNTIKLIDKLLKK